MKSLASLFSRFKMDTEAQLTGLILSSKIMIPDGRLKMN